MANATRLSASHIKYLLLLQKLDNHGKGVRGSDLATALGVTKPSVHTMLRTLQERELVSQPSRCAAHLTPAGAAVAQRYGEYYAAICTMLSQYSPPDGEMTDAVYALLSELPEEYLDALCRSIRQQHATAQV